MTQTEIFQALTDLNELVLQGKSLEAFQKYYHSEVVMQENENPPTIGKEANLQREQEFYKAITEFRGAHPLKVTVGNDCSMVEWHYDYTHKEWGIKNYTQVSVQEWQDGKIIQEKFYYNN
jgi:hypothetical protein